MVMNRTEKEQFVAGLHAQLKASQLVVVAHYRGVTAEESKQLRRDMRANGAELQVVKNRLAKLALKDAGFADISEMFAGPVAIGYSEDAVAAAKVMQPFAKSNDAFEVVGGSLGEKALDAAGIAALSAMPSLDELRGKLVGLIQAPATKLAGVTQAPAGQVARVIGAYAAKAA